MSGRTLRYLSEADMPTGLRLRARAAELRQQDVHFDAAKCAEGIKALQAYRNHRRDDEHNEQVVFFNRIRALAANDQRYAMAAKRTFAIPNGGGRSKREAGRLKAEGVRKGVSDVMCAYPAGGHHGLYIEMKSAIGRESRDQVAWREDSLELGYAALCAHGADEAFSAWMRYLAPVMDVP